MASQLRLRVLLPVAILGILGLGVGALALGGPSSSGDGQSPGPLPTHAGTPTSPTTQSAWARRANSWCARLNAKVEAATVEEPSTPEELDALLVEFVKLQDSAASNFPRGWPSGKRSDVLALRATLAKIVAASHQALAAFQAGDNAALKTALERSDKLTGTWNKGMRRLGAPVCADDPLGAVSTQAITKHGSAQAALNHALLTNRVVVVLFYAPGDDYDTIQARETRAGALAAKAGFLALNVTKNQQVAALAAEYDVREAPATLIFTRGPRVAFRVAGYMDRQAVAQAATDAQR